MEENVEESESSILQSSGPRGPRGRRGGRRRADEHIDLTDSSPQKDLDESIEKEVGMTRGGSGITRGESGMTMGGSGMTRGESGITKGESGMTRGARGRRGGSGRGRRGGGRLSRLCYIDLMDLTTHSRVGVAAKILLTRPELMQG